MAQGRSTKITTMIKWIRTSRLSTRNSLFPLCFSEIWLPLPGVATSGSGRLRVGREVPREEEVLSDPGSHISKYTLVHQEKIENRARGGAPT